MCGITLIPNRSLDLGSCLDEATFSVCLPSLFQPFQFQPSQVRLFAGVPWQSLVVDYPVPVWCYQVVVTFESPRTVPHQYAVVQIAIYLVGLLQVHSDNQLVAHDSHLVTDVYFLLAAVRREHAFLLA